jgi:hypothetical protein
MKYIIVLVVALTSGMTRAEGYYVCVEGGKKTVSDSPCRDKKSMSSSVELEDKKLLKKRLEAAESINESLRDFDRKTGAVRAEESRVEAEAYRRAHQQQVEAYQRQQEAAQRQQLINSVEQLRQEQAAATAAANNAAAAANNAANNRRPPNCYQQKGYIYCN